MSRSTKKFPGGGQSDTRGNHKWQKLMRRRVRREYKNIYSSQELKGIRRIIENEWASPRDGKYQLMWKRDWTYSLYRYIMNK